MGFSVPIGRLLTTAVVLFPAPNRIAASRQTYKLVFPGIGRSLRRFASASLLPYWTVAQPEAAMARQIAAKRRDVRMWSLGGDRKAKVDCEA